MCNPPNARIFVRTGYDDQTTGKLPDINCSPKTHMNYDGKHGYTNSGYLSLFEYVPKQSKALGGYKSVQSAAQAIYDLNKRFVQFYILPVVNEINLNENNVESIPKTGRTPTLFNTKACNSPSVINIDSGETIEYADRKICE